MLMEVFRSCVYDCLEGDVFADLRVQLMIPSYIIYIKAYL